MQDEEINTILCKIFSKKQRVVGFYIHSLNVQPDQWMRELGRVLRERGYGAVGLFTEQSKKHMYLDGMDAVYSTP